LNAGLAKWMFDSGRVKGDRYVVRQGTQVGRNGRVFVEREGDGKIFVGGRCKTIIEGKVKMPS
jgi:predicted PhzF superfamily epimerase YddE/YHI9